MSLDVRPVCRADADELADLLNAIIARGGTTALEDPFTGATLSAAYLLGPEVICCFVAVDPETGRLEGFQTLGRYPGLPDDIGDIGTFSRVGGTQRGVGSALFTATKAEAKAKGLSTINATIRDDNTGGLTFYGRMGFVDHDVIDGAPLKDGRKIGRVRKRYPLG